MNHYYNCITFLDYINRNKTEPFYCNYGEDTQYLRALQNKLVSVQKIELIDFGIHVWYGINLTLRGRWVLFRFYHVDSFPIKLSFMERLLNWMKK